MLEREVSGSSAQRLRAFFARTRVSDDVFIRFFFITWRVEAYHFLPSGMHKRLRREVTPMYAVVAGTLMFDIILPAVVACFATIEGRRYSDTYFID